MALMNSPTALRRLLFLSLIANAVLLFLLRGATTTTTENCNTAPATSKDVTNPVNPESESNLPYDSSRPARADDERIAWLREAAANPASSVAVRKAVPDGPPSIRTAPGSPSVDGPFQDAAAELYLGLYAQHAEELRYIRARARDFCASGGGWLPGSRSSSRCFAQDIEMEVTYLRLRYLKPRVVWEISPAQGYSSVWILHALKVNDNGAVLHSFDRTADAEKNVPPEFRAPNGPEFHVHVGEAGKTYPGVLASGKNTSIPDYVYFDAGNSKEFALFSIHMLAEVVRVRRAKGIRGRVGVSVHGVYDPSLWNDKQAGRNLQVYPRWMPSEQGTLLLDHIAYHLPSTHPLSTDSYGRYPASQSYCNIHSFASSRFPRTFARFLSKRDEIMKTHAGKTEDTLFITDKSQPWKKGMPEKDIGKVGADGEPPSLDWTQTNPTVWFEVGCRVKILNLREEMKDDGVEVEDDPEEEDCCACPVKGKAAAKLSEGKR